MRSAARAVLLLAALAFALAACDGTAMTSPSPTAAPDTGIRGVVLLGPTCPVEQVGASPCVTPYAATLVIRDANEREVGRVTSGADGRFEIRLPPGQYVILPQNGDPTPTAQLAPVTVVEGQFADVTINYDTGIR